MIKVAIVDDSDSYLSMIIEILLKYGLLKKKYIILTHQKNV